MESQSLHPSSLSQLGPPGKVRVNGRCEKKGKARFSTRHRLLWQSGGSELAGGRGGKKGVKEEEEEEKEKWVSSGYYSRCIG